MEKENEKVMFVEDAFNTGYNWNTGRATGMFLRELKYNARIVGSRCPECKRVMVPPKLICPRCFTLAEEGIEVADRGEISASTVVYDRYPNQPLEPPYTIALIRLDGADTDLIHLLMGDQMLPAGTRVKAVWKEKREGNIFDIECFIKEVESRK